VVRGRYSGPDPKWITLAYGRVLVDATHSSAFFFVSNCKGPNWLFVWIPSTDEYRDWWCLHRFVYWIAELFRLLNLEQLGLVELTHDHHLLSLKLWHVHGNLSLVAVAHFLMLSLITSEILLFYLSISYFTWHLYSLVIQTGCVIVNDEKSKGKSKG